MTGFILGALVAAGFFWVGRFGGGPLRRGWGRGAGHLGWRARLRWLFYQLDTSPGQEKVVTQAAEEVADALRPLRDELRSSREALARALRAERFDGAVLQEAFAREDAALARLRRALGAALGRVHEALEPHQRGVLADLVAHGPWRAAGRRCAGGWAAGSPPAPRTV